MPIARTRAGDAAVAVYRFAIALLALVATHEIWLEGDLDGLVYFTNQAGLALDPDGTSQVAGAGDRTPQAATQQ